MNREPEDLPNIYMDTPHNLFDGKEGEG